MKGGLPLVGGRGMLASRVVGGAECSVGDWWRGSPGSLVVPMQPDSYLLIDQVTIVLALKAGLSRPL